ncbi:MAG: acetyl-coenzyme A synthetase N-terminal domain-containing protein, partial [Burkholderiales bacterium]
MKYADFHRRSIAQRDDFWREEAKRIDWHKPFDKVLDYSKPPFAKWFVGGETNLCHNAVDRHLKDRGDQNALVWISTEVDQVRSYSYKDVFREVNRTAAMM